MGQMTANTIHLCTWNVNGIHTPLKRKKVLSYLRRERVHIALLQETQITDLEHLKLQQEGVGQVFFSSFSFISRGVAILLRKNFRS